MQAYPLATLQGRFWRMLGIRWQRSPLGSGAHLTGGRWNRQGQSALYLSLDHSTAIAEYNQAFVRPGTLVEYDISAGAIADFTDNARLRAHDIEEAALTSLWREIRDLEGRTPPSWELADALIAAGAEGALVPSVQHRGGTNLVLWRWGGEAGAEVRVIDPERDLG
jgi:RES domain-containing protein